MKHRLWNARHILLSQLEDNPLIGFGFLAVLTVVTLTATAIVDQFLF